MTLQFLRNQCEKLSLKDAGSVLGFKMPIQLHGMIHYNSMESEYREEHEKLSLSLSSEKLFFQRIRRT